MNNKSNMHVHIKKLHEFYVKEHKLLNVINFKLCMVKTLLGLYPNMNLWEAKLFIERAL